MGSRRQGWATCSALLCGAQVWKGKKRRRNKLITHNAVEDLLSEERQVTAATFSHRRLDLTPSCGEELLAQEGAAKEPLHIPRTVCSDALVTPPCTNGTNSCFSLPLLRYPRIGSLSRNVRKRAESLLFRFSISLRHLLGKNIGEADEALVLGHMWRLGVDLGLQEFWYVPTPSLSFYSAGFGPITFISTGFQAAGHAQGTLRLPRLLPRKRQP